MKSSNFLSSQQHHLQDHVVEHGSCVIPSSMAFPCLSAQDNDHAWRPSPSFFLNKNNIHGHAPCDEATPNSFNNSMIQGLRFSSPNNSINIIQRNPHNDHHQNINISNQIKEESSTSSDHSNNSSFQTFRDMLSPSTTPISQEMLLLNTLSPTYKNLMLQSSPFQPITMGFQENNNSNSNNNNDNISSLSERLTTFSQIFPSVNISKLSSSTMDSGNFRGGLDGFATERFRGGGSHNRAPNSNLLELLKGSSQFGVDHDLQKSNDLKLCNSPNNLSSFKNNGLLEPRRPTCIIVEPKSSHQSSSKKQRFKARASCPPLKVRQEKLGDRVAALQQLVAPFGKTDTASVLMEAIGYIKFLQGQVETLSVPYTKLGSHNKSSNNIQKISSEHFESEANKQDLRSKGLCLVPLTCVSYVTSDLDINGGGVWSSHHNYNPRF